MMADNLKKLAVISSSTKTKTDSRQPKASPPKKIRGNGDDLPDFRTCFMRYVEWKRIKPEKAIKLLVFFLEEEALHCFELIGEDVKVSLESVFEELNARCLGFSFKIRMREKSVLQF